jgi:hypothetical protein
MGFIPIGIGKYVQLHVKANPDENPKELLARLRSCVSDALAGARCSCGAPIWVVGSVSAGYACFTCITGEAFPAEDYEIDQVCCPYRICYPARMPLKSATFKKPKLRAH